MNGHILDLKTGARQDPAALLFAPPYDGEADLCNKLWLARHWGMPPEIVDPMRLAYLEMMGGAN